MTNVYALQFPSFSTKEKLLAGLFDVNNIVIVKIKAFLHSPQLSVNSMRKEL